MEKDTWKSPLDDLIKENKTIYRTGLFVKNSLLANKKVEFITRDGSKNINWYMCGPTVYDKSHLGHARTYIGFDIIRRILENYFGYNVNLCMNITDIDDKIIKKVIENADKGEDLYTISRKYEDLFFQDMEKLNVKYPDRITRVTEYIPEIIEFIQKLIKNDYAYESNNSVYFNINNFLKAGHQYAKLDPTKVGSAEISQELDGVLGSENVSDKKNKNDFALWKKSKDKEPSWSSPFGRGRPGWHIECSVMCTSVLGKNLDIHSGGYDLKFPHHDNEIAQTEGYYNSHQWINYFLHTGHLNINGLKMSKSLKNFLTIDDIMKQGFSANSFRLSFLNHKYDLEMNYTEKGLEDAYNKDLYIKEYFRTLKRLLSVYNTKQELKYNSKDIEMENLLIKSKNDVHEALCNNFSTETVLEVVNKLISNFNIYATNAESSKNKNEFKVSLAYNYGNFISYILKCFGLVYKTEFLDNLAETDDSEKIIEPFVSAIADYRDDIRNKAIAKDFKGILQVSDNLRDNILPYLGIRLKDRPNEKAIYSIENKDDLIKEIEFQKKLEKQKEDEKRKEKEMKELKVIKIYIFNI